jgi:Ran GTPase-activating protein (RanGAP) involved in mRNA processing and transport
MTSLRCLKLSHNRIMDRGAYVLSTLHDLWSSLEHVELAHCGFSSSGFSDLCHVLQQYAPCLHTLDFHGNHIQSTAFLLLEALQAHVAPKRQWQLYLSSCNISSEGNIT